MKKFIVLTVLVLAASVNAFAGSPSFNGLYQGVDPVLSTRTFKIELRVFEPVRFGVEYSQVQANSNYPQSKNLPLSYSSTGAPLGILDFDYLTGTWTQQFDVTDVGYNPPQIYKIKIMSADLDTSEALLILPNGVQVKLKQIEGSN